MTRILAVLVAASFGALASAEDKPKKKPNADASAADLKWAKGVADDFLTAGTCGEFDQAVLLMAPDMRKALEATSEPGKTFVQNRFHTYLDGAKSWSITGAEMAPDRDEATFKGAFRKDDKEANFTVRVTKEKDGGKWRVSFFTVTPLEKKEKK
jgi:hypothetical protein